MNDWTKLQYHEPEWLRPDYNPDPNPISDGRVTLEILGMGALLITVIGLWISVIADHL